MPRDEDPIGDRYYRPQEFADALGVTIETVRGWLRQDRVPCVRLGRVCLIPKDALERLLEGRGRSE